MRKKEILQHIVEGRVQPPVSKAPVPDHANIPLEAMICPVPPKGQYYQCYSRDKLNSSVKSHCEAHTHTQKMD